MSREQFNTILSVLEQVWAADTTYPTLKDQFSDNNKALGHCATTSVIIADLFGGRIIYDKANFHVWNELPDGTQQDFTRSQFTNDREFSIYKYQTPTEVLTSDNGTQTQIIPRYQLLKERFLKIYQPWDTKYNTK